MNNNFENSAKILKLIMGIQLLILIISLNVIYIFIHVMRISILITLGIGLVLLVGGFMGLILGLVLQYEANVVKPKDNDSKKSQ